MADFRERDRAILLPDNSAPYLIEWLFDIGPSQQIGMGEAPISYRDIVAWQEVTGIELSPWEARTLRQLSSTHISASQAASAFDCPAPFAGTAEDLQDARKSVDTQIKAAFGSLKKAEN